MVTDTILILLVISFYSLVESVLTPETKRVPEHFDFPSFDKENALNNIDWHRYNNQVRGKRSQKHTTKKLIHVDDGEQYEVEVEDIHFRKRLKQIQKLIDTLEEDFDQLYSNYDVESEEQNNAYGVKIRQKRAQHSKRNEKKLKISKKKMRQEKEATNTRHWGHWSEWSACSVTCGLGRTIRNRKCLRDCEKTGEVEMNQKACQLPSCSPFSKIINLFRVDKSDNKET